MIDTVARIAGRPVPAEEAPRRAGDPARLVADPARAQGALDWTAAQSDLDTIVETALAWHRGRNA
ncbi:MAG: hypothetical protein GVY27_00875 [Deinococcus-Thermus bacterium]|nr:hypothetical protein [Deinococcota bacterium]